MATKKGLYLNPEKSAFPEADEHHYRRILDVSGLSRKGKDPATLGKEDIRNLHELDYFLFQDGLPSYLDRTKRYDRMDGDPVDLLFSALPTPEEDDNGFAHRDPIMTLGFDREIVQAIWPYANSSLEEVVAYSTDPNAHDYWWLARFAFSLWDRSDLSIRCAFTEFLAQLACQNFVLVDDHPVPDIPDTAPVVGSGVFSTPIPATASTPIPFSAPASVSSSGPEATYIPKSASSPEVTESFSGAEITSGSNVVATSVSDSTSDAGLEFFLAPEISSPALSEISASTEVPDIPKLPETVSESDRISGSHPQSFLFTSEASRASSAVLEEHTGGSSSMTRRPSTTGTRSVTACPSSVADSLTDEDFYTCEEFSLAGDYSPSLEWSSTHEPPPADEIPPPHDLPPIFGFTASEPPHPNKQAWLRYARWIHEGRQDHQAPTEELNRMNGAAPEASALRSTLGVDTCCNCGAKRGSPDAPADNMMFRCSGCFVESFPTVKRIYCSQACQKADWPVHYGVCQRQKHFLRAVLLLCTVSLRFQMATYSNIASESNGRVERMRGHNALKLHTIISPTAWNKGHWLGDQVFASTGSLLQYDEVSMRRLLAVDSGDNLHYHLRDMIRIILGPHCESVTEMSIWNRNIGGSTTSIGNDIWRELDQVQPTKGKNPAFWPHPVLKCRLRGATAQAEENDFIIDMQAIKFGFTQPVLPFRSYIISRYASCHSSRSVSNIQPRWYPPAQKGLFAAREAVASFWLQRAKKHFTGKYKAPGQLAMLKQKAFQDHTIKFFDMTEDAFEDALKQLIFKAEHRLYLHHDPNPYAHDFTIGVTVNKEQVDLYKNIWLTEKEYDVIIKQLSEKNKALVPGSETCRLVALWMNRLAKHGQKEHFNAPHLLGEKLARHYNIHRSFSAQDCRALEGAVLQWGGIKKADVEHFYSLCDRMFGAALESETVTPKMLQDLMSPEATMAAMKGLTPKDAQVFLEIGSKITAMSSEEYIRNMQMKMQEMLARG